MTKNKLEEWCNDWASREIIGVGHLVKQDEKSVVVGLQKDYQEMDVRMVAHAFEIPRAMIRAMWTLRRGKRVI